MSDSDKHSKTEQPTAKKLEDAKKKGSPPQSRDLTTTIALLVAMFSLHVSGSYMVSALKKNSQSVLANLGSYELTEAGIYSLMLSQFVTLAAVLGPFMLIVVLAGIAGRLIQGGVSLSSERISPNLEKLNPITGAKKFFKKESLVESLKSFIKIIIVGVVGYRILKDEIHNVLYLIETDISGILEFVSHISFKLVLHSCGMLLILSLLDFAFIKWQFIQNQMMTKQEVKDEHKNSDGDPQVKGRIKRMQFENAFKRLKQVVPTADVVVTNPTHFAVALKYDREKMAAPFVIAKGADHLAQTIKRLAKENNVMIVENKFLARELYAQVQEGKEVPESMYVAIAELLAYVYSLKGMT